MARPTCTPTREEREEVRRWIEHHSVYRMNGTPKPGFRDRKKLVRYPRGITSFAICCGLSRRVVRKVLNTTDPVAIHTWHCIRAEMNEHVGEYLDELALDIANLTGQSHEWCKQFLEGFVDKSHGINA